MRKKFNVIGLLLCTFFVATSVMFSGGSNKIFADVNKATIATNTEKYVPKKDYSSSLVANYKMDETSGTVCKNSLGNGNDGTYNGTTSVTDSDGTYRSFNGTSDYIQFNNSILPTGKKTIRFKIKTDVVGNDDNCYVILDTADGHTNNKGFTCFVYNGIIRFYLDRGIAGTGDCIDTKTSINDNKWHEIMFTWTGDDSTDGMKVYVDNMSIADNEVTHQYAAVHSQTDKLTVGKIQSNDKYFKGLLSNIQIYNDVLEYNSISTGITLNKTSDSINVGETDTLSATVNPSSVVVTWSSSDSSIATVDSNGKITGVKAGQATITVTTADGKTATCVVTVTDSDSSDKAALNITMTNGQVKQYNVTMNEVNKFISWYKLRSAGSGDPFYEFDITQSSNPNIVRTDYVIFDKISSFEVDDYTK
ncbi:Ig-like domain (group 2) [Clostridium acidisoli DSM 12555]|uniref:Ig-like domain (Group 2) n=1 Tax=Clostridium acidisoli DSM 12555 TaxID=1121291 RepID=A0A1W1X403_9CLOT|nr:LamG-like jellyroll fold domain-containing protein [Clostridium acidisoli]SMC18666.1 Ig-like domain (group 2) [Clostridium acidisoli DSM 12555]